MSNETTYTPPTKEDLLLQSFLEFAGKEYGAVLVDISHPDVGRRSNYKMVGHSDVIKAYLNMTKGEM